MKKWGENLKMILEGCFLLLFLLVSANTAKAATILDDFLAEKDIEVGISAGIDFYSDYVWRGFLLDDDPVIQPSVTLSAGGFEGGFWGSWDLTSDDSLASDEVDGWIGYGFDLGFINEDLEKVGMSVGHTWYAFPEGDTGLADGSHTEEYYVGVSLDTILSPSFTWYHDYGDEPSGGADGNYYMFSFGHSFTLNEEYGIALDVGYEVSINDEAFIAGEGGYNLWTASLSLPLKEGLTASPVIGYSLPFGDLEDSADGNQPDKFYGGVSLAFEF